VLQVDVNGREAEICEIFDLRNIEPPPGSGLCPDSAPSSCYSDCDATGVLDFWDFLCFQNAFAVGDPYADCDGDGDSTFFDFLCFQNEFIAGCP